MTKVSIKSLRVNLSQIIEETAIAKKRFTITKFGKPKAAIVPLEEIKFRRPKIKLRKLPAFGMWKGRKGMKSSGEWVRKLRDQENRRSIKS